jgi:hypothetical protein
MMNFLTFAAPPDHVDIAPARPYLCPHRVDGDGVYFARVFAVEPWIARFPLNWRMTPRHRNGTATRHGELMGNPEHDPEKWVPVFGPDHAQLNESMTRKSGYRFSDQVMLN